MNAIVDVDKALQYGNSQLSGASIACKAQIYRILGVKYHLKRELDSSLYAFNKAAELSKKINKYENVAYAYSQKAFLLTTKNNEEKATLALQNAREALKKAPNSTEWSTYYSARAKLADKNKAYKKAIIYLDSAIQLSKKLEKPFDLTTIYHNKGVYYIRLANYEKATAQLMKTLALKEEKKMGPNSIANTLYLIGICNMRLEKYKNASIFYKRAIANSKKGNNKYIRLLSFIEISIAYRGLKKNNIALQFLDSAEVIGKNMENNARLSQIYSEKGIILSENKKRLKEAEKYLKGAYALGKTSSNYLVTISSIDRMVNFYLDQKNYPKVKLYLEDLKHTISITDIAYSKEAMHKYYSEYYENTGKPTLALEHFKKYHKIRDSIANKETKTKVADLEKKYDSQKKELVIANLTEQKELQNLKIQKSEAKKNTYLIITLSLLILLFTGIWAYSKLKKQRKELIAVNQIKNRLFSIIAHDLRSMILPFQRSGKILKYHIKKGNYDKTVVLSEQLEANSQRLSNTLDNLLDWSLKQLNGYKMNPIYISVKEELLEIISGYEQQANYKKTVIEIESEENIEILFDKGAFHVIFRNLISNALKYTEQGLIKISFKKEYDDFICNIKDTGVGMSSEQIASIFNLENKNTTTGTHGEKGTGLGLKLVHRFIEINKGNIKVSSEKEKGTLFEMRIPIVPESELEVV
ncbi:tetratricopeptide repeat-containing sensor histidine kinase [Tenacibaculum jejuense]|nr:tetratricopeptide repeat-containing sensor histidine kinase [Tenacibaculum jejuense]